MLLKVLSERISRNDQITCRWVQIYMQVIAFLSLYCGPVLDSPTKTQVETFKASRTTSRK